MGACAGNAGVLECQSGTLVDTCNPLAGALPDDQCDGFDNDCDGLADDDFDPAGCSDGLFCNGMEVCAAGACAPGPPLDLDDGVSCTEDSCDEANDVILHVPNDGSCDDGLFCNGVETCDAALDCQAGAPPCAGLSCHESTQMCLASGVGSWAFDEGSGTTVGDGSGFGNDGSFGGTATWTTGVNGSALDFQGNDDLVIVPDSPSLDMSNAITIAAWIRPSSQASQYVVKKARKHQVDGYELSLSNGGAIYVRFNQVSSGSNFRANSRSYHPTDGTWMHVAATFDGQAIRLYVNGVLERVENGVGLQIAANDLPLAIGGQDDGSKLYNGAVDEVYLDNRALTEAEVQALAGVEPTPAPLEIELQPAGSTAPTAGNADDPAVWIHPTDPSRSVIIGADKVDGIYVWDLSGQELQHIEQGSRINNVDVRSGVAWGAGTADVVAFNLRALGKLGVFLVNPDYDPAVGDVLVQVADGDSTTNTIQLDSYGLALHRRPADGALFVFERPKETGVIRQYRVDDDGAGGAQVTPVRDLDFSGGVAEGMVVDDELGFFYVSEEAVAVHKFEADPAGSTAALASFAQDDDISGHREGLGLYLGAGGTGYLVLSSQGNGDVKVYERQGANAFVGTISKPSSTGTDGLDATSAPTPLYPQGFLITHDASDSDFDIYDWAEISAGGFDGS